MSSRLLERLVLERGKPKTIRVDNGPEFAGRLLDQWAYLNGVGAGLLQAGNANRQCPHRSLQRPYPGRVPQRQLVLLAGRCPRSDRGAANRLQHRAASLGPESPDAQGLRSASSTRPKNLMTTGPDSGARPTPEHGLYPNLEGF
jgi:hypothetical protein